MAGGDAREVEGDEEWGNKPLLVLRLMGASTLLAFGCHTPAIPLSYLYDGECFATSDNHSKKRVERMNG